MKKIIPYTGKMNWLRFVLFVALLLGLTTACDDEEYSDTDSYRLEIVNQTNSDICDISIVPNTDCFLSLSSISRALTGDPHPVS